MKSTIVATFLAISGFAISGFAIASPANAQTAIVAALYQNPTQPQTEVRYESADINRNQIILAVNTTPEVMAIADNLLTGNSYDRIVTMSHKDNLACIVSGTGSVDGTVMCGFIDHE
jgi:nitrate reductase beta subunit